MKTIILCGGRGTRLKEETEFKPKAMVEVGGKPMLWHIMKIYAHAGFNEFVIALGYKGNVIKDYFLNWKIYANDYTHNTKTNEITLHNRERDDFKITFVDTGLDAQTGERILKTKQYIPDDEFMITYGDGVSDIDIKRLVDFHRKQGTIGTITGVKPRAKFGMVTIDYKTNLVSGFKQKPIMSEYVSGGFMVFKRKAFDYFDTGDMENAFEKLAKENQLSVYPYDGFWKSMDTYYEMEELNTMWKNDKPWAIWENENTKEILES